jgi:hypothetical protein
VEDYTGKYKGEQVEVALFGGEYQEGVLTAYCYVDEVAHIEHNPPNHQPHHTNPTHHTTPPTHAQAEDWPPRGLLDDDGPNDGGRDPDES